MRGRPGDLPLLQFALTELWERDAAGGVLTEETYRGLGVELPDGTRLPGAQGALIRRAERLWQDLGPANQLRLQRTLLGLIAAEPAETSTASPVAGRTGPQPTSPARAVGRRRPAPHSAAHRCPAAHRGQGPRRWPAHRRGLPRGTPPRLAPPAKLADGAQPSLCNGAPKTWPRTWSAARQQQKSKILLPRSLLEPALRWLRDYPDELAGPPARYIQASKWHRVRRRRLFSGAAAVLLIASLVGATIAIQAARTANAAALAAVSGQLAAQREQSGPQIPSRQPSWPQHHGVLLQQRGLARWPGKPARRSRPARSRSPSYAGRLHERRGVQPGRQDAGHRRLRRQDPAVGHRHPPQSASR